MEDTSHGSVLVVIGLGTHLRRSRRRDGRRIKSGRNTNTAGEDISEQLANRDL